MITHLLLPINFDPDRLSSDLEIATKQMWKEHFNTWDYDGGWSVIPLYAPGGDPLNINAIPTVDIAILPTPVLDECTYFRELISGFECDVHSARLMKLDAGAIIKPHVDHNLGYEDGMFRIHVPLLTNSKVEFILNGEQLVMNPGECWYTNVNFEHSVANRGTEDRVHLVIDYARNEWSDQLFFSLAPEEELLPKMEEAYSRETILKMIDSFKLHNDPAFDVYIEDLRKQLDELQ